MNVWQYPYPPGQTSRNLLLLGAGDRNYREYALESLGSYVEIMLVQKDPQPWHNKHARIVLDADPRDESAVLAAVRASGQPVDGVLTYDEFSVQSAAEVAAQLGCRQNTAQTAVLCRDKGQMRSALRRAGVPSAQSIGVTNLKEAAAAAHQIGFPVVVKPAALAGSIGVVRVDSAEQLPVLFASSRFSGRHEYGTADTVSLVEEYLDGPEVSVESVVHDGAVDIVAVTRKEQGKPPFFEETGHIIATSEPVQEHDGILEVTRAVHAALEIRWGVTHTEIRLTRRGPHVVEIAARAAGDLIPLLVHLATGRDLMVEATAGLLGIEAPPAAEAVAAASAVRFVVPEHDVIFESVALDGTVAEQPWLHSLCIEAEPGQLLRTPPNGFLDRIGYAIATGANAAECSDRLSEVFSSLRVSLRNPNQHEPSTTPLL